MDCFFFLIPLSHLAMVAALLFKTNLQQWGPQPRKALRNTLQVPYNGTRQGFTLAVQQQNIAAKNFPVRKSLPLGFLHLLSAISNEHLLPVFSCLFSSSVLYCSHVSFWLSQDCLTSRCWLCMKPCVWEVLIRVWWLLKLHCFVNEVFYSPRGLQKVFIAYRSEDERALADTCGGQHLHWDFVLVNQKQQNQPIHGKQTIRHSMCCWGAQVTQGHVGA